MASSERPARLVESGALRVMAEDSYIGCPEVMAGLIPLAGGTQRLPMLIGASKAKELILTGKIISSAEAVKLGLVTKVASRSDLVNEAKELAKKHSRKSIEARKGDKVVVLAGRSGGGSDHRFKGERDRVGRGHARRGLDRSG